MLPCGNGLLQLLRTGGVQEVEEREGGAGGLQPPPPQPPPTRRCWASSVPRRVVAAAATTTSSSFPLGSPTSGPMGEAVRAATAPGLYCGWGDM